MRISLAVIIGVFIVLGFIYLNSLDSKSPDIWNPPDGQTASIDSIVTINMISEHRVNYAIPTKYGCADEYSVSLSGLIDQDGDTKISVTDLALITFIKRNFEKRIPNKTIVGWDVWRDHNGKVMGVRYFVQTKKAA